MYKFDYWQLLPEEKPLFTCVVPAEWLSKSLPTMGGCVDYVDKLDRLTSCAPVVYEFSDAEPKDESSRTLCLSILSDGRKLFAKPATIHCPQFAERDGDDDWCVEVALLNHFFAFNAPSASMGNVYLDYADFEALMQKSSDFEFKYAIGETPADILPGIMDSHARRSAKGIFGMMFCKPENMRLAYFNHAIEVMSGFDAEDGLLLFGDVGVDQEKMLISMLVGR